AGHPDTLQFELQMRGQHFLFDLQKNHALLPKPPNIFLYLPNGTGESLRSDPVVHCFYHGSVRGYPESRVALSTCSGLRGVIAFNSSLSLELHSTHRRRRDILSETKYIELVLVVDHQEFLNYQKNNKTIIYRMLDVANQVDWVSVTSDL
ncbi:hypothetical protein JOQ06_010006, partial [Pogonophryne albipinna]